MTARYPENMLETLGLPEDDTVDLGATLRKPPPSDMKQLRSSLPLLPIGTSREFQFQLSDLLGQGAMGMVHLAHQTALGRDVAIKTAITGKSSERIEEALLHEARVMGLVEHPSVVPVHTIGQDDDGRPVIVMKRIEGTTWDEYVEGRQKPDAEDEFGFHLSVVLALCRAVEFAHHRQIVHRDIKPENVMIGKFGEVYLLDWGLAASVDRGLPRIPFVGDSKRVVGTPIYIAPEMTVGDGERVGKHSDIFLLGAVLYHAVTGEPPNRGKSLFDVLACSYEGRPRDYPEDVSDELRAICETAMALDPADRYANVANLREAIEQFVSHRSSHELVRTASARLEQLQQLLAEDSEADDIHRMFGETRFGFESALEIWAENEDGQRGLQESLRLMIRFELDRENVEAARALVAQLPLEDEGFRAEVLARAEEVEKQRAALEKLAYDYDENVGIATKRWLIAAMAFGFAIAPFVLHGLEAYSVPPALRWLSDDVVALGANLFGLAFLPMIVLLVYVTWKRFRDHKASRVFAVGLATMYLFGFGARTTSLWAGVPLHLAAAAESAIFSCGLLLLGLAIDRRLAAAGFCFGAAPIPLVLAPEYVFEIYSLGAFSACVAFLLYDHFSPEDQRGTLGG